MKRRPLELYIHDWHWPTIRPGDLLHVDREAPIDAGWYLVTESALVPITLARALGTRWWRKAKGGWRMLLGSLNV